ncbi:Crp/Fnr family transcriptional regulator [Sapientia aquatica]|nr:helix-turn-helix domain-containing protein [Sapientia aquatica]
MLQESTLERPVAHMMQKESAPICTNWTSQNKLWSNLAEVAEFLHVPMPQALQRENVLFQHMHFKAGQRIHTLGQNFDSLYLVNSGFIKTILFDEFGTEQVLSFPMKGDVLGMDSIHCAHHSSEAIALSDCDIILLPYKTIATLSHSYDQLGQAIFGLMSKELARQQTRLSIHGSASAEARVAKFLLSLSERFFLLGYSKSTFNLRMTRNDIGSYLGLTLETVSRTLSALNELGLISVSQRHICINDAEALRNLRKLPSNKLKAKISECFQSSTISAWGMAPALN